MLLSHYWSGAALWHLKSRIELHSSTWGHTTTKIWPGYPSIMPARAVAKPNFSGGVTWRTRLQHHSNLAQPPMFPHVPHTCTSKLPHVAGSMTDAWVGLSCQNPQQLLLALGKPQTRRESKEQSRVEGSPASSWVPFCLLSPPARTHSS